MKPNKTLRSLAGFGIITVVVGLWAWSKYSGATAMGSMWDTIVVLLVIAAAYAVFGAETMKEASETAAEVTEGSDSEGDEGGSGD